MSIDITVPEMGESIVDARVAKWLKREGEAVAVGEPLVELETDKIDVEVPAPQDGVLTSISHKNGDDVKIGDVLGAMEPRGAAPSVKPEPKPKGTGPGPSALGPGAAASSEATPSIAATPSARRLAREERVPLASVAATGPRVTAEDVRSAVVPGPSAKGPGPAGAGQAPSAEHRAPSAGPVAPTAAGPGPADERDEDRVRLSKRRVTIAKRLLEAQQTAAMLTTFNEVDMGAVMALRERRKQAFKATYGVGLGVTSFFVKAAIAALRDLPRLNAEIQGDEMVLKYYYDIGVAVGAAEGLVVPVLRNADRMSFVEIELAIREYAQKATDGTLTLDDLKGGTFTITNGGVFGSLMSTPILNPPQVGILGLHAVKERPTGVGGQVVLRPMMYTALTYDHRLVDGAQAVKFLVRIKDLVEDPGVLLIES